MYSTSIQRRLFGETLEIIRAALHGEPLAAEDAATDLDLPSAAPGTVSGVGPGDAPAEGGSPVGDASTSDKFGKDTSAAGTFVPTGRAAATFFRGAAWDASRSGTEADTPKDNDRTKASTGDPGSVPAADEAVDRRNVRSVLGAAPWNGSRSPARVIPLDRASAQEAQTDQDPDAEAFQRAATESALAAARGGRGS